MSTALDDGTRYRLALHAAALAYINRGWRVIPLKQVTYADDGKKTIQPLIKWQRDPAAVVTTPEQVERWFGLTGQAQGLAIATGDVLAVDLDEYKDGYEGLELPAGGWAEQHTGRGGGHVYLANPTGERNTAGRVARVDTRGDGGLSVAAPTRCYHADGRVTQWQTVRSFHDLPAVDALPAAPVERFASRALTRSAAGEVSDMTPEAAAYSVARGREEWLTSTHGSRHDTLVRYLAVLIRYELAHGAEVTELIGGLEAAALEHPDAVAGEEFESVDKAISWAIDKARATPWRIGQPAAGTLEARFAPPDPGDAPAQADTSDGGELFATGDPEFYDNPAPPPEAVYGAFGGDVPLFYGDGVHWLQGESESGKTWLGLSVVHELLESQADPVIVVDYEDTRSAVVERLRALGMTRDQYTRLVYVSGHDVSHAELRTHLETTKRDYALMLLDGVTSALTAAGANANDGQEVTRWADQVPRRARMAICVDHVVKAIDDRRGMAIGSTAKKSVVTGTSFEVACLRKFGRGRDGVIELRIQKDKRGGVRGRLEKAVQLTLTSSPDGRKVALGVSAAGFFDNPDDALWGALLADGVDGGIGVNELAREAKDRGAGYGARVKAEKHASWLRYYTESMAQGGNGSWEPPGTTSDQQSFFSGPT